MRLLLCAFVLACACGGSQEPAKQTTTPAPTAQPAAEAELQVYVLECGEIWIKDVEMFSPGVEKGVNKNLTNTCYVIKHGKETLLWDAIHQPEAGDGQRGRYGGDGEARITEETG